MANRSYLYTLDKVPTAYADRPNTITGLSEFAYFVPSAFYLLVSDDTTLCPSLLFEPDEFPIFALCGKSDKGVARLDHLIECMMASPAIMQKDMLADCQKEMRRHTALNRQPYMYLSVAELDSMTAADGAEFRSMAEGHYREAFRLGELVDSLTPETVAEHMKPDGFLHGAIAPDGYVDNIRDDVTETPIGIGLWTDVLYFAPWNAAEWVANQG